MKRVSLFLFAACLAVGFVHADDNQFAGPYAGLNVGFAQGTFTTTEYYGNWDYGEYSATSNLELTYGVQVGYNFAVGNAGILGIELAYSMPDLDEERTFDGGDYINRAEWNNEVALRFKGGLAMDKTLFYAIAGIVRQDVDFTFGDLTSPTWRTEEGVSNQGLSYGAGFEVMMSDLISLRGEYLFNDSQSEEIADMGGDTGDFHSTSRSLTFGLNFHF